ncbi:MAG TPA: DUF1772 domain-containing protein [Pseudolabrys sp.]|jgi:hypothetical protein|nr:DUF1772 domain-containing protein [Pseudolabrys sp.]
MRIAQFFALILTALALVPVGAHLAALPNKIGLNEASYFIAQRVYDDWAWFGVALIGAILANAAVAIAARGQMAPFVLAAFAALLMLGTLAIFFAFTFPANQATANWTMVPDDWQFLRRQWEFSHAVNAVITFAAFCCLSLSVILSRR